MGNRRRLALRRSVDSLQQVIWVCLRTKFSEFHFHFSFQQDQSSQGWCTGPAVLVQVFWFLLAAALHVLACFLPSNLSFIKLHHAVPLSHSVFVRRFFFLFFFCLGSWKVCWEDIERAPPPSSKHSCYRVPKAPLSVGGLLPWALAAKQTMWVNRAVVAVAT